MYDFKRVEREVLEFWHHNHVFEKTLDVRKGAKHFVFFEGPPTANGRPGIHHFLGRAFKDIYARYKTMRGFFVLRKAGWDTHGLPVEIEIEKELGFKNKRDIENYGIEKFNKKARESVWKYKTEWEEMTRKMGFWLDMKDPYVTYENNYIESLWSIIKKIWDKKLLYLAHKVVHFCTRCGTPLSSHEVAQGYKKVKEKSVYIKFKLLNFKYKNTYILAWTTTPWTLPGNVALAVGKNIQYVVVEKDGENFIVAKDLAEKVFGPDSKFNPPVGRAGILDSKFNGSDLVGLEYNPLFDIPELKSKTSYKVYDADFVSTQEGTGIVHTAVMYGEDDYNLGTKLDLPKFHTVDEAGKFINVGADFDGLPVKHKDKKIEAETTNKIIAYLDKNGSLFKTEEHEHDYPFCWRCDSPLLYYAKNSWFIKMSSVREQLLKNNQNINWFPEHIKEGRFGQWLKEGKDWAISRERYWGTPLPIWKCQKCGGHRVIGSVAELQKHEMSTIAKKNTYYILRHGYTTRGEKTTMIISSDLKADKYHLTEDSVRHIEKSAEFIKNNYKIDLIYSSPFIRTVETAEIVAKTVHLKIHKDDRLGEIRHGGCEGNPHSACPFKDAKHTMDDKHHELGESWNDIRLRMVDFMAEMESKHSGKSILIVSHGDPLWLLNNIGIGTSAENIIAETNDGREHYLKPGEFQKLDWKLIPRNGYGELDLHRPFIDEVYLKCSDCGASMKKVPDLIDVWFDSGAMPYAQWHWPFENKKMFEGQFPADFIVEGMDQTRGWFYTLLAISTLLGKGNPYKNVMSLGHVLDDKGKKMSKSKGNVVSPFEVMDKVGADTARWYFYTLNSPGEYKNFSMKDVESKLKGFIFTLQNCIRFYELYQNENPKSEIRNPKQSQNSNLLDEWILSKLNGLVGEVSDSLDKYDPTTGARAIEKFVVEDLSNWWLRRSRKRKDALGLLRFILLELAKVLAPFVPFMAEDMYRGLNSKFKIQNSKIVESVHLHDWPKADKKLVNKKLEEEMEEVRRIVTAGLAVRKDKQIKVRQPLAKLTLGKAKSLKLKAQSQLVDLIKEEVNVKDVIFDEEQEEEVVLDLELSASLIHEGYVRELIRQIQDMRKEAKYKLDKKINGQWHSDDSEVSGAIHEWTEEIKKEALLKEFVSGPGKKAYDIEKEFELVSGKKIWVGVRK